MLREKYVFFVRELAEMEKTPPEWIDGFMGNREVLLAVTMCDLVWEKCKN